LTNLIPGNGLNFSSITGGINSYLFGTAGGSASSAGVSAVAGGLSNAPSAGLFGTYGAASLGGVLGAAGLGFGAGSLLNGLVGGNETGGTIGSAGGALAGAIIGSIVPGIGTIIGGLIGGAGGGLLGGLFGSGPSVGPVTVGRVTDLTDPSSAVYTFDNGGDSEDVVTKIIDAIVEGIEAGTERYAGALRPGSGLDIAYFSGPDAESSQGAGINLKPIIDSVLADTDRFRGLSPDEAVQQATFIALSEMVDYQSATLDELVRNTKATDLEGLLSDLDYGRNLDDLTEALRANGDAINANSLAIAQNIVDRKRRAEETAKNRAAPIATASSARWSCSRRSRAQPMMGRLWPRRSPRRCGARCWNGIEGLSEAAHPISASCPVENATIHPTSPPATSVTRYRGLPPTTVPARRSP